MTIDKKIQQGLAHLKRGEYQTAENFLLSAADQSAENWLAQELLGILYIETKDYVKSEKALTSALGKNPRSHLAWNNLGNAYALQKKYAQALDAYKKATHIAPNYVDPIHNTGKIFLEQNDYENALKYLNEAISRQPRNPNYYIDMGLCLQAVGYHEKAIEAFQESLRLQPNQEIALHNLINSFIATSEYSKAIDLLQKLDGKNKSVQSGVNGLLIHCAAHLARWKIIQPLLQKIEQGVIDGTSAINPFHALPHFDDPEILHQCTSLWLNKIYGPANGTKTKRHVKENALKRIGFVSPDFKTHPVGLLAKDLIRRLCLIEDWEVFLFSLSQQDGDPLHEEYKNIGGEFIDISRSTTEDAARQLNDCNLDVVVDMAGLTEGERIGLFQRLSSSKTVSYLGYPAFLGKNIIDNIFAHPFCFGEQDLARHQLELPVFLNCMPLPRDPHLIPSPKIFQKADFGIHSNHIVFGSFCKTHKITEEIFDTWLQIMKAVPNSVLYLGGIHQQAKANLTAMAKRMAVSSDRIVFASKIDSIHDHLARLKIIDVFLDTHPYGGHTTVSDAISASVPVVTMLGNCIHSRIAAAFMQYFQLPELIATSLTEYKELAVKLALHNDLRESLKQRMAKIDFEIEADRSFEAFRGAIDNLASD